MEIRLYQGLLELNWNLLFSAVTVLVLYMILKRFFFEKVRTFMLARQASVEEQLMNAEEKSRKAENLLEEYSQTLASAEEEKRRIIKDARVYAEENARIIIDEAQHNAGEIMEKMQNKIKNEEEKARRELQNEVASLAVLAAGKIMKKELEADGQEALIGEILTEAEEGRWQKH